MNGADSYLKAADKQKIIQIITILSSQRSVSFLSTTEALLKHEQAVSLPNQTAAVLTAEDLKSFDELSKILAPFQEQPQILGPHISDFLVPLNLALNIIVDAGDDFDVYQLHLCCKVIQLLCRIRGHKYVMKHLPHEVRHIEVCMFLLNKQSATDYATWESRYVLLLWLGMLCLIPFDLTSLDSSGCGGLVQSILRCAELYLRDAGPCRDAAALCLSSLLTRPDMEERPLQLFLRAAVEELQSWSGQVSAPLFGPAYCSMLGRVTCLAQLFKRGHRQRLLPHASSVLLPCVAISSDSRSLQVLLRKLLTKLFQRIAIAFLPPIVAKWRYDRGKRSLQIGQGVAAAADGAAAQGDSAPQEQEQDEDEDDRAVPDEVEEVIERLVSALSDKDTVVRWSAAKGIGRVSMLLPRRHADDVLLAVLQLFDDQDQDCAWHGACLCVAELSRRGLLLPGRLCEVVPLVAQAIRFDKQRGQHSVGAQVRDAACYVCWAFARAYSPAVLQPFIPPLKDAMIAAALFDREVNCRRSAAAALQENVGRQGNLAFPLGIELVQRTDYLSLGNRNRAYLQRAPSIGRLDPNLNRMLMDRLMGDASGKGMCEHWDPAVRALAAQSLRALAENELSASAADSASEVVQRLRLCLSVAVAVDSGSSPNLFKRHGCLLAASGLLLALGQGGGGAGRAMLLAPGSGEVASAAVSVVLQLEKARLYRGRGGELVRAAACQVVEAVSRSGLRATKKQLFSLLESLNEHLRQPHESVQLAAASALREFLFRYFNWTATLTSAEAERLRQLTVGRYTKGLLEDGNVAVTRGCAMGLGSLSEALLLGQGAMDDVLASLSRASDRRTLIAGEADAATRCRAVDALIDIAERVLDPRGGRPDPSWGRAAQVRWLRAAAEALLRCCEDYSVDKRGDTGSWVRVAALQALERAVYLAIRRQQQQQQARSTVDSSFGPAQLVRGISAGQGAQQGEGEEGDRLLLVRFAARSRGWLLSTDSDPEAADDAGDDQEEEEDGDNGEVEGDEAAADGTTDGPGPGQGAERPERPAVVRPRYSVVLSCAARPDPPALPGSGATEAEGDEEEEGEGDSLLSDTVLARLLCAFCKQLAEKLDAVRQAAGDSLARLLQALTQARAPAPPAAIVAAIREALRDTQRILFFPTAAAAAAVGGEEVLLLNWSKPDHVFPFAARLLAGQVRSAAGGGDGGQDGFPQLELLFSAVLSGLVISIGGLTETTAKEALRALVDQCKGSQSDGDCDGGFVRQLGSGLLDILRRHSRDDRVVLPTIKAVEKLLRAGVFDLADSFAEALGQVLKAELVGCRAVGKLLAYADLTSLLLAFRGSGRGGGQVRRQALRDLLALLAHKYPVVRKYVAELLYVQLLSDPNPQELFPGSGSQSGPDARAQEEASALLAETGWADDEAAGAGAGAGAGEGGEGRGPKQAQVRLLQLAGWGGEEERGGAAAAGAGPSRKGPKKDKWDTYDSLVRDAGY